MTPELSAVLDAQKNAILSAVNSQIQGLQTNLLQAQSDLAVQIATDLQPDNYVFNKKGNEQQFSFNRKVAKTSNLALKALEGGNIPKAKEELNKGISLLNNRQKIIKLADKSEFGWATVKTLQEKKSKTSPKGSSSALSSSSASRVGGTFSSFPPATSYFRPQGRYPYNSFRGLDMCFRCGKRGHWANMCPTKDKPLSSGSKP